MADGWRDVIQHTCEPLDTIWRDTRTPISRTLLTDAVGEVSETSPLVSIEKALWPECIGIWPEHGFVCVAVLENRE
jgi:hypothetical protein